MSWWNRNTLQKWELVSSGLVLIRMIYPSIGNGIANASLSWKSKRRTRGNSPCIDYKNSSHYHNRGDREDSENPERMVMERDIDDLPKNPANYTALTPLCFLERAALVHPNRKSVVHGSLQYTWLQTYRRCRRLASALSRQSVAAGSTVLRFLTSLKFSFFCFLYEKWKKG